MQIVFVCRPVMWPQAWAAGFSAPPCWPDSSPQGRFSLLGSLLGLFLLRLVHLDVTASGGRYWPSCWSWCLKTKVCTSKREEKLKGTIYHLPRGWSSKPHFHKRWPCFRWEVWSFFLGGRVPGKESWRSRWKSHSAFPRKCFAFLHKMLATRL